MCNENEKCCCHEHEHEEHCHHEHHDHECDCGCEHDEMVEYQTVTLTLEDNKEMECAVIEQFELDGQEYIVLLPVESEDDGLLIYKYSEEDGVNFNLEVIDDDDEFKQVCDHFEALVESEEN